MNVEEEISKLQERFKINFFQIEKAMIEFDKRIETIESKNKEISDALVKLDDKIDKLTDTQKPDNSKIDEYEGEIIKLGNDFESKYQIINNKINELTKKIDGKLDVNLQEELSKLKEKQKSLESEIRNIVEKKFLEYGERINKIIDGASLEKIKNIGKVVPVIEKNIEEFNKKFEQWNILIKKLEYEKSIYFELREVVINTVDRLKKYEEEFTKNLEEFGIIRRRLENTERQYSELSTKMEDEIDRLNKEGVKLEETLKENIKNLEEKLEKDIKEKIVEQDKVLSEYSSKIIELMNKISNMEKTAIPKEIDNKLNELLVSLSNKIRNFVTTKDFENVKLELKNKLEEIRKPELGPLEDRIYNIEEDIEELKKLVNGVSKRLPVVVE